VLALAGAQIDRRWWPSAATATQPRQNGGKRRIPAAPVADETAHSILALGHEIVMPHAAVQPVTPVTALAEANATPSFQSRYAISVPASAIGRSPHPGKQRRQI
jgi:hypothetical protein